MNKRDLDFARGEFFRDSFIQKAVLFFTGDIDNESDDVSVLWGGRDCEGVEGVWVCWCRYGWLVCV